VLCPSNAVRAVQAKVKGTSIRVIPVGSSWLARAVTALLRVSGTLRARFRFGIRSRIDRAADKAQADFVWFIATGVHFTDRPFMTVVWDLQHLVTPWFPEMSSGGKWDQRDLSLGWFLRRAAFVVTGTRRGAEELERYYQLTTERIVLLPHPTPRFALRAEVAPNPEALNKLGISGRFLLYPAQFWAHKNHVNLLLALKSLDKDFGQHMELVLVGSDKGNLAHVKAQVTSLGLEQKVRILGFVSRSDLLLLYRNAFALVYVSMCGPENLPPLEAFALGCPVVAARVPGAEEQLGDAVLFCDPADPKDIARSVARLHEDETLRAELIRKGDKRARKWTSTQYVEGVFSALDRFEPIARNWTSIRGK